MTFIAGIIYNETIQIIADSVETSLLKNDIVLDGEIFENLPYSSFGEKAHVEDSFLMHEAVQKIFNINDRVLLAFAGHSNEGLYVIDDLSKFLLIGGSISEVIIKYFSGSRPPNTEFIIGFFEDNQPYIFTYSKGSFKIGSDNFYCVEGGIHEMFGPIQAWYKAYGERKIDSDDALIHALALLQRQNITGRTIKHGVGGFFNGSFLSKTGVTWAKDTIHILYSIYHDGDRYYVFKFNRKNMTFICSYRHEGDSVTEVCRSIYKSELDSSIPNRELYNLLTELNSLIEKYSTHYYIWNSYDRNTVVVINIEKENDLVFIRNDEGRIQLGVGKITYEELSKFYIDEAGNPDYKKIYMYTNAYKKI
jgi:hypothetical protein